ncbi:TRAP transporter large permease [Sneathiella litorea]|uniref:TRAP transporter large permease protein n=1 Tax=Sneathiella litorea TaxID=2606216 RepID=A0A6L8W833_9PROT|nr:TRAP transporter large permease [Sneathiella litorea]MZR30642.1 TRAP transporter large permease subunit [Sneathiella litorea]
MDFSLIAALVGIAILLLLGIEIFVCLGIGAIMLIILTGTFTLDNIGIAAFSSIEIFPLLAMPLYILTGDLISESGIARRLVSFARATIGWINGGLALTVLVASGMFAAISGSNSATVAAMGKMLVPEMKKDGYPTDFSGAVTACGGTVGIIIPPSIVFVLYGVAAGVPVGDLFIGGIIPGLLMIIAMAVVGWYMARRNGWGTKTKFTLRHALKAAWDAKLAFGASFIILAGIYGGIFTPTEAAAAAVAYCLFVGLLITRELKFTEIPKILNRSADINGLIAPVIAMALILSQILAVLGVPEMGVNAILGISDNPTILTLCIVCILLIAGAIMEATPNILLLVPLLVPVATTIGIDPVHFGVITVVSLAIGFVTPPVGLNLYVASSITDVPFTQIAWKAMPFICALVLSLLAITFIPQLTTMLLIPK